MKCAIQANVVLSMYGSTRWSLIKSVEYWLVINALRDAGSRASAGIGCTTLNVVHQSLTLLSRGEISKSSAFVALEGR